MTDTILWQRLDQPGHEFARLAREDEGWLLAGTAVFLDEGTPCRLDYAVRCDARWRTVAVDVSGRVGVREVHWRATVDSAGRWCVDGAACEALAGCVDIDLGFSPATNLLPIRRLGLAVGAAAPVRAAWLRFPSFAFEPLEQVYTRLDERRWRYESGGGRFVRELEADPAGFVVRYPDYWVALGRAVAP